MNQFLRGYFDSSIKFTEERVYINVLNYKYRK